jgi:hypothetical protein
MNTLRHQSSLCITGQMFSVGPSLLVLSDSEVEVGCWVKTPARRQGETECLLKHSSIAGGLTNRQR